MKIHIAWTRNMNAIIGTCIYSLNYHPVIEKQVPQNVLEGSTKDFLPHFW